jgi:hypothetical protein
MANLQRKVARFLAPAIRLDPQLSEFTLVPR